MQEKLQRCCYYLGTLLENSLIYAKLFSQNSRPLEKLAYKQHEEQCLNQNNHRVNIKKEENEKEIKK
ncbi:MAG: hypothetical protein ACOCQQ_02920 [Candidatus Nanoarchaeia archaeon]